jgi:PAS domain S-box-containing protein
MSKHQNKAYPIGRINIDNEYNIEEINSAAAGLLGVNKSELIKKKFVQLVSEDDINNFNSLIKASKDKFEPFSKEFKLYTSTGFSIFNIIAIPYNHKSDSKIFYKILLNDISESIRTENELNKSEKQFRLMADDSPVMIWMTDSMNKLEYMNKAKLKFLGKTFKDLTDDGWMKTRHPEDQERFLKTLINSSNERKNFSIEIRVLDNEGKYRWLLDTGAPRFTEDGDFAGFIGSGIDITEEKNFRTELQKSLKEKEVLLAEIHHRVKNNLQVVSSLLRLQSAYIEDEKILSMFQTSRDRIRSMAILHEKLYQSENIHAVKVKEYLEELLSYLISSYNQVSNIKLDLNVVELKLNIESCLTLGLIVNELVSNALKHAFIGRKSGEINVSLIKNSLNTLQLSVKDNGIGIPEENKLYKSNSLGLMLVKALVEQQSGSIHINRNGYTEFNIQLEYLGE